MDEMTPARLAETEREAKERGCEKKNFRCPHCVTLELCVALRAAWKAAGCWKCDPDGWYTEPTDTVTRRVRCDCGKASILAMLRKEAK